MCVLCYIYSLTVKKGYFGVRFQIKNRKIELFTNSKLELIWVYIYALYLILGNSSVFFAVKYSTEVTLFFFGWSVFLLLKHKIVKKQNFNTWLVISSTFLVTNLINIQNSPNWIAVVLFLVQLCTICIFQSIFDIKKIYECVVKSMVVISLISLITFFIRESGSSILDAFVIKQSINASRYEYIYTPWHTIGWNVDFHRNAGPFWEPGMFACYLAISICILLFSDTIKFDKTKKNVYFFIFIITILSTSSTTGFLVLGLILSGYVIKQSINNRFQVLMKIGLIVCVVAATGLLYNSSVVQKKLFTTNSSLIKRSADITNGIEIIKEDPLFGLGFKSEKSRELEKLYDLSGAVSNGLIQGCYRMGVIMFILLLLLYWRGLMKVIRPNMVIFTGVVFLVLMFGEPIQIFLIFLSLLFIPKDKGLKPQFDTVPLNNIMSGKLEELGE